MTAEVDNKTTGEIAFMDSGDTNSEQSTGSDFVVLVGSEIQTEGIVYTEKELEDRLSNLEQQVQELQSCNEHLNVKRAELESENDCFKQQVDELKDDIKQLREQLKENHKPLKAREEELQAQVKELQAQVKQLQIQVKQLERKLAENEDKLYLSQVAVEFERAICCHVIPEVFSTRENASSANIKALLNMLNSRDQGYILLDREEYTDSQIEDILKRARYQWERICDTLNLPPNWKKITGKEIDFKSNTVPDIFRAMSLLKYKRNLIAHPTPVSLQEAEKKVKTPSIKDCYVTSEFKVVKKFIESGLRESIQVSGIKIDKTRLKFD